ncbi:MAG: polymer-forming cytoskeletal protein [Candidatus Promineifilaceae bacterium]|nr:polymer-forming cytoskeletal protein [Candidatus Promineifilaceae bacterium]
MKRKIIVLVLLIIMLAPAAISFAANVAAPHDRIIGEGEVVEGDVNVFGERLEIKEGGVVQGDVTLFDNGTADVAGLVEGDVFVFTGEMTLSGTVIGDVVIFDGGLVLEEQAAIEGECFSFGGDVDDESDSVSCTSVGEGLAESLGRFRPPMFETPSIPSPQPPPSGVTPSTLAMRVGRFFVDVFQLAGLSLSLGILALVVTALFPRHLEQVGGAIRRKPAASGVVGLLTAIAAPSLILLLLVILAVTCVGIVLYPAVFLLGLVPLAAAVMGWVALGDLLGRTLAESLGLRDRSLPVTAALGTVLLTLVVGALGLLPFVWGEWLVIALLLCVGLGAAALTQFGTKPYPPGSVTPQSGKGQPDVTVDV